MCLLIRRSTLSYPKLVWWVSRWQSSYSYNSYFIPFQNGVKKIKIVNFNFHNQITDHVTALIPEQFLVLWLDHFLLWNWHNVRYRQTSKQTNKQTKIENFNIHNQIWNHVTAMKRFCIIHFAKGKWSNHDSKNCSEIRTVTWSVIWFWKLKFTILIFFTPLYFLRVLYTKSAWWARSKVHIFLVPSLLLSSINKPENQDIDLLEERGKSEILLIRNNRHNGQRLAEWKHNKN